MTISEGLRVNIITYLLILFLTIITYLIFDDNPTCCLVSAYSSDEANLRHLYVDRFDIIETDDIIHSRIRSSRDLHRKFNDNSVKKVQFSSSDQKYNLILTKEPHLTTKDFTVTTLDGDGNTKHIPFDKDKLQVMVGYLQSNPNSTASVMFNGDNNLMTAHINLGTDMLIVEPAELHQNNIKLNYRNYSNDIPQNSNILSNSMIIYKFSDYKQIQNNTEQKQSQEDLIKSLCPSINMNQDDNVYLDTEHDYRLDRVVGNKSTGKSFKRSIEYITEPSRDRTRCSLHIVADYLFYQHVGKGDLQTTINYILALINRVNQIYLSVIWQVSDDEDSEKFSNIGFSVQNVTVHQEYTRISTFETHYNMRRATLWSAKEFLDNFSRNSPPRQYCLAHLLTYREFDTPVLGLAYVASHRFGTIGGICSSPQQKDKYLYKHNTGISTSKSITGETLITRQADLVVAHELGHNLGAEHDSAQCRPSSSNGGGFLMEPFSVMGFEKNNRRLSNCSIIAIGKVIKRKGPNCFVAVVNHVCGNGIVEDNEECDGGDIGLAQNDPCCDSMCRLRPDAQCSDRHSWCCSKCKIMPFGTPCRPAEEYNCRQTGYCDGHSAQCPPSLPVEDNQSCVGRGVCKSGECQPFCEARNLMSCLCNTPKEACKLCCKSSPNGTCVPFDELKATSLPNGVLCYRGVCEKGRCEQPIQDVVERLWDILEDLTFSTFVKFLRDNIIFVVLVITIPLWCIATYLINLWDHRVRYDVIERLRTITERAEKRRRQRPIPSAFIPQFTGQGDVRDNSYDEQDEPDIDNSPDVTAKMNQPSTDVYYLPGTQTGETKFSATPGLHNGDNSQTCVDQEMIGFRPPQIGFSRVSNERNNAFELDDGNKRINRL